MSCCVADTETEATKPTRRSGLAQLLPLVLCDMRQQATTALNRGLLPKQHALQTLKRGLLPKQHPLQLDEALLCCRITCFFEHEHRRCCCRSDPWLVAHGHAGCVSVGRRLQYYGIAGIVT